MKHAVRSALCKLALPGGLALFSSLTLSAQAAPAAPAAESCTRTGPAALRSAWQGFRSAMLQGQAEQTGKFLRFPLKLLPPMRGDSRWW